jgi:glucose-6-phosphate 1-dehydrogenase
VNSEELNWLLQTIQSAATAKRFVLAQYERGRISSEVMADVARERGWINHAANQFFTALTCDSNRYESSELPIVIGLGADV